MADMNASQNPASAPSPAGTPSITRPIIAGAIVVVIVIIAIVAFAFLSGGHPAQSTTTVSSAGSTTTPSGITTSAPTTTATTSTGGGSGYPDCSTVNITLSGPNTQKTVYCAWSNTTRMNITLINGNYNSVLKLVNKNTTGASTQYGYACGHNSFVGLYGAGVYEINLTVQGQTQSTCGSNTTVRITSA